MLKYLDDTLDKQIAQTYSMDLGGEGCFVNAIVARMVLGECSRREQRLRQSALVRHLLASGLENVLGREQLEHCELDKLPSGKPVLYSSRQPVLPAISLSHSHDFIACAWSGGSEVGVDIESMQPRDWGAVQDAFLHPEELAWIIDVPEAERALHYYCLWCLKEAFYKVLPPGEEVNMTEFCFSREHGLVDVPPVLYPLSGWKTYVQELASEKVVMAVVWRI